MPPYTFIVVSSQGISRREHELQQSIARTHAATVSYKQNKRLAKKPAIRKISESHPRQKALTLSTVPKEILIRDNSQNAEYRQQRERTGKGQPAANSDVTWQWINGTSADPFDIIPGANKGAVPYALEFCK